MSEFISKRNWMSIRNSVYDRYYLFIKKRKNWVFFFFRIDVNRIVIEQSLPAHIGMVNYLLMEIFKRSSSRQQELFVLQSSRRKYIESYKQLNFRCFPLQYIMFISFMACVTCTITCHHFRCTCKWQSRQSAFDRGNLKHSRVQSEWVLV